VRKFGGSNSLGSLFGGSRFAILGNADILLYISTVRSEKGVCQRLVEQLKQTERGQISKGGNERNEVVWLNVGDRVYAVCMRVSCSYRLLLW
jgi:hypothetical protein